MKNSQALAFGLLICLGLSMGACKKDCEPVDVDEINSIYLQFNTGGGPGSFNPAELDSVYFVRYSPNVVDSFLFAVDTFNLYQIGFTEPGYKLRLGRTSPSEFSDGAPYYSQFMYRFLSRDEDFQVRLQQIELVGHYTDDCEYVPELKRFMLNDDTLDVTGSTQYVQMFKD